MTKKIFYATVDYLIIPIIIFFITFEPNFLVGYIDHLEAGQYLSCINGIFHNKIPYKDFITFFGPLSIYLPAFFMLLFGKTIAALKIYFHFTTIISFILLYFTAKLIIKRRFFVYLVVLLSLIEIYHPFWSTQWIWFKMGLGLLCIGLALLYYKKARGIYIFLSGLMCAILFLYSLEAGVFAIIAICAAILLVRNNTNEKRSKYVINSYLMFSGGFLLATVPFFIYIASKSALSDALYATFYVFPFLHAKAWEHAHSLLLISIFYDLKGYGSLYNVLISDLFKIHLPMLFYGVFVIYISGPLLKKLKGYDLFGITLFSIYGLLLYISSFRAVEGPQFQISIAPFIILCGVFLEKSLELFMQLYRIEIAPSNIKQTINKILGLVCVLSIFTFFVFYVAASQKRYYGSLANWFRYQTIKKYLVPHYLGPLARYKIDLVQPKSERVGRLYIPRAQADEIDSVTNFIIEHTEKDDIVFCFPEHSIYNFLADRPPLSRFYIAALAYTAPSWRKELFQELSVNKPKLIICSDRLSNLAMSIGRKEELLPEIGEYIDQNYVLEKKIQNISIMVPK